MSSWLSNPPLSVPFPFSTINSQLSTVAEHFITNPRSVKSPATYLAENHLSERRKEGKWNPKYVSLFTTKIKYVGAFASEDGTGEAEGVI
jgi:hypothetical protein